MAGDFGALLHFLPLTAGAGTGRAGRRPASRLSAASPRSVRARWPPWKTRDTRRAALAVEAQVADPRDLAGRRAARARGRRTPRRAPPSRRRRAATSGRSPSGRSTRRGCTSGSRSRSSRPSASRAANAVPQLDRDGRARGPSAGRRAAAKSCAPEPVSRSTTTPRRRSRRNVVGDRHVGADPVALEAERLEQHARRACSRGRRRARGSAGSRSRGARCVRPALACDVERGAHERLADALRPGASGCTDDEHEPRGDGARRTACSVNATRAVVVADAPRRPVPKQRCVQLVGGQVLVGQRAPRRGRRARRA